MDDTDIFFLAIQTADDQAIAGIKSLARRLAAFNDELKRLGVSAALRSELVVNLQEGFLRPEGP